VLNNRKLFGQAVFRTNFGWTLNYSLEIGGTSEQDFLKVTPLASLVSPQTGQCAGGSPAGVLRAGSSRCWRLWRPISAIQSPGCLYCFLQTSQRELEWDGVWCGYLWCTGPVQPVLFVSVLSEYRQMRGFLALCRLYVALLSWCALKPK